MPDKTRTPPFFAGIDVGASATKAVIIDAHGEIIGHAVLSSGVDFVAASQDAFDEACQNAQIARSEIRGVVSTGYGRKNVVFANGTKTEIACHARGAFHFYPQALTLVDIGGQDNKIIKIGCDGARIDFKMNRKCAAGTGAFIEETARRMGVPIEEMESLARKSTERVEIGSFCTVFSATEILALIRQGKKKPDIAKGIFRSVVKRVTEMDPLDGIVVVTGGVVAHNPIVVEILADTIGHEVKTPPLPQLTGAFGAALYAVESDQKS